MESNEAPQARFGLDVRVGKFADGQLGVTLMMDPAVTVTSGEGNLTPGLVMLPWEARLLAYTLLHQAEVIANGLHSPVNVV
jgi:hypothetical protein